jgi:hypothetical protein
VSKKLIPNSKAVLTAFVIRSYTASDSLTWLKQLPSDITDTLSPELPRNLYSIKNFFVYNNINSTNRYFFIQEENTKKQLKFVLNCSNFICDNYK